MTTRSPSQLKFRGAAKGLGLLSETQFFIQIGNKAGYVDPVFIKRIYNSMLDVVYQELREKGAIRLPQFQDIFLIKTPARRVRVREMKVAKIMPESYRVDSRMIYSVKKYFRELGFIPGSLKSPTERLEEAGIKIPQRGRSTGPGKYKI